jgi:hypothetical protein
MWLLLLLLPMLPMMRLCVCCWWRRAIAFSSSIRCPCSHSLGNWRSFHRRRTQGQYAYNALQGGAMYALSPSFSPSSAAAPMEAAAMAALGSAPPRTQQPHQPPHVRPPAARTPASENASATTRVRSYPHCPSARVRTASALCCRASRASLPLAGPQEREGHAGSSGKLWCLR